MARRVAELKGYAQSIESRASYSKQKGREFLLALRLSPRQRRAAFCRQQLDYQYFLEVMRREFVAGSLRGVRPKLLQHRQPSGRRAHRFACRTGNWLCAVLPTRWFYTAAIRNVVERRYSFKYQANERRIGVAASTFTAHFAHSRNIISGTPERECCWHWPAIA